MRTIAYAQGSGSVIEDLLAEGVSRDDIHTALAFQKAQRKAGARVASLRQICGLTDVEPMRLDEWKTSTNLATTVPKPPRRLSGGTHITRRPVWAGSVQIGSPAEDDFARPLTASMRKRITTACYQTFKRAKALACEARSGARELSDLERKLIGFTTSCRDILLKLLDDEQYRKGWSVPAYETIMRWTGLSRSTVHRSLRALADIGLIEWIRRFIYTKDEFIGARSEQTSNLYRFDLPGWLAKLIGLDAPIPDDHAQRSDEALEEHALMLATLPPGTRSRMMPSDPAAHSALIAAALRVDGRGAADRQSRECQKHTPPQSESLFIRREIVKRPSRPLSQP